MLTNLSQAGQVDCYGGKAANLSRLLHLGLPAPAGVVIPDWTYQSHLRRAGVLGEIERLHAHLNYVTPQEAAQASRQLCERITATPLHHRVQRELDRCFGSHWHDRVIVVRSSAVGEDGCDASFAGQLESFLNINSSAALTDAIKRTWSSLWSPRALLYAKHFGIRPRRMGVILQDQINARLSGVLFTRDPQELHADRMLLEYCAGLGDQLVGGSIDPARLLIRRSDLAVTVERVGDLAVPPDARDLAAIVAVAGMALEVEARFGAAQDIEWCVDQENRPVLLQARPITRPGNGSAATPQQVIHWSNSNIGENYPEPVSPFLYSIAKPAYTAYFRSIALGLGLSATRLDASGHELDNVVGLHAGRLYYNLTSIHALQQLMPDRERRNRYFTLFVGAQEARPRRSAEQTVFGRLLQWTRIACFSTWHYLGIGRGIRLFERRIDRFAQEAHPERLASKTTQALIVDLRNFLDIRMHRWRDAGLADNAAMVCYGKLKDLISKLKADAVESSLHNCLLKGLPGLASTVPVHELWKLSRRIRVEPLLAMLFAHAATENIAMALAMPQFQSFRAEFDRYLERWGFRFSGELMLTAPTPRENPLPVLRLLRTYANVPSLDPELKIEEQARSRAALTDSLARLLTPAAAWRAVPIFSRASRFRLLLRATHAAIRLRERARMKQALLYTRLRHIALEVGDRLVQLRLIAARDDVFMLTTDEVLDALCGEACGAQDLQRRIVARRREFNEAAQEHPPEHLALPEGQCWRPAAEKVTATMRGASSLAGIGASGGTATGEAAVLLDVAHADELRAGQILITRQTDPGWATVFFLARGLVVERGGMLSHGAIIAREYGIPAVVGIADATHLIHDGDIVDVDGTIGQVRVRNA